MDDSVRTQENTGSIFRKRERIGNASQVPAEKPIVGSDKPEGFDNGTIEKINEFLSPEELYQDLLVRVRKYHPSDDISMIEKAYELARKAH